MRVCASFAPATAPSGVNTTAAIPARAAYAAALAAVFPVDAHSTAWAPSSSAFETATVIPRSLYEPVGLDGSHLSHNSRRPAACAKRSARSSGVDPSPSDTTGVASATGSRPRKRSISGAGIPALLADAARAESAELLHAPLRDHRQRARLAPRLRQRADRRE